MIARQLVRKSAAVVVPCIVAFLLVQACGGGGGGGGSSSGDGGGGGNRTQPIGVATFTPTPPAVPSVVPTLVVSSGQSIAEVAKNAAQGATIIVPPGLYGAVTFQPGDIPDGLQFVADVTGAITQSASAPVIIEAHGSGPAIALSGQSNVSFDSFTLRDGTVGFLVTNSPGTVIEDCVITGSHSDGVQVNGADGALLFNNLITNSGGAGIDVRDTPSLQIINNTIYNSMQSGVSVDSSSSDAFVENNIFNHNRTGMGIAVAATAAGFEGDFNLNTDGYEGVSAGKDDVHGDPIFLDPSKGDPTTNADFHLAQGSPAIDAGDDTIDAGLLGLLTQDTTQSDGTLDSLPPDLGYHYFAPPTPTPAVKPTRTPTPRPATPKPGTPSPTPRPQTGTATPTRKPATAAPTNTAKGPHGGTPTPRPTKTPKH